MDKFCGHCQWKHVAGDILETPRKCLMCWHVGFSELFPVEAMGRGFDSRI